jgi:putative ABC transport system permease protein
MVETLLRDVRGALHGLRRSPGFAAAALVTLSLGIGATSAVFSVVKTVLLTPLPYDAPERRVMVWSKWVNFDKTWVSSQDVFDYRQLATTLTGLAFWANTSQNLTEAGEPVRLTVGLISANTFQVLGASPFLGRTLTADDEQLNGPAVAVLGYGLWQGQFGGDAGIVGRRIMLNDVAVEVIGVMPEGFRLPTDFTADAAEPTALWRPLRLGGRLTRAAHTFFAAGVLAPGQTPATATAELRAITARLTEQGAYERQRQFTAFAVGFDEEIRGGLRPAMWLLMGAVGCLLLIACVNVANLLLVRGDARAREMAVRTAIGASPARLARQLFTESAVLAVLGAALGLGLAAAALRVLTSVAPTSLPPLAPVRLDLSVVVFTLLLGVTTTLLFGLVPALRLRRGDLVESLRDGQHGAAGHGRQRLRGALVAGEVALAVMLVIGAGLMIRTLAALGDVDLGFNPDRVLTMRVTIPGARYDTGERVGLFFDELQRRVRALPGVEAAGVMRALPLAMTIGDFAVDIDGFEESPGREAKGHAQAVSHGAFDAMGTRLVRGRWFSEADTVVSAPVAVVNETMARAYWRDSAAAIGGRIRLGSATNRPWATVVGIVADERHDGVTATVREKFFIPHIQWPIATAGGDPVRSVFVVARTAGDPLSAAGAIRNEIRQMDASLPIANVRSMHEVLAHSLAVPRLTGFLLGAFAAIALALAAVGIYGVVAYLVSQRTHEIGIRLAIGAERSQVLGMVLRQGLLLAAAGIAAGLLGALALTRLMATLLYGVRPNDPLTFAAVATTLLLVALAASVLPALRATRVSPTVALREG